jgi:hypothetical protein
MTALDLFGELKGRHTRRWFALVYLSHSSINFLYTSNAWS